VNAVHHNHGVRSAERGDLIGPGGYPEHFTETTEP